MITLKTLSDATAQEVFDQVATHLLTQKRRSIQNGRCLYRSTIKGTELKCAAGCLIADDEYKTNFEDKDWINLIARYVAPLNHEFLIYELQSIHDHHYPNRWQNKLKSLAKELNLEFKLGEYITVTTESHLT